MFQIRRGRVSSKSGSMFSSPAKSHSFDFGSPIHGRGQVPVYHDTSHRTHVNDSHLVQRVNAHPELSVHSMDRIFIKIIDEIHYEYMKFDKIERIRIENWVNKLVSTAAINTSVLGDLVYILLLIIIIY